MKKIKKIFLDNIKTITAFILGGIIFGGIVGVAAYVISAGEVTYDNTNSGTSVTTVQGAIDELYTRSSKWVNPNDMETPTNYVFDGENQPTTSSPTTPPSGKNVYVGLYTDQQYGVCINRNGNQHCFRYNNWIAEKEHIQDVFSDASCRVSSNSAECTASDFGCFVRSDGYVTCSDYSGTREFCRVRSDATLKCTTY